MITHDILLLFEIDYAKATKNGDYLPEFVSGTVRYVWDPATKSYTDTPKSVVINAFFHALKKSKLDIVLPASALTQEEIAALNAKADAGEDILMDFSNLKIGLSQFRDELKIIATAGAVKII